MNYEASSDYEKRKAELLEAFDVSYWLKDAIRSLENRDPVDALRDADTLHSLQTLRLEELLGQSRGEG